MSDRDGIAIFLSGVRRRLLVRAGIEAAGYGVAAFGVALAALGLGAVALGPADLWPTVTAGLVVALVVSVAAFGLWVPARRMPDERAAARRAGLLWPKVASDLLSAVELEDSSTAGGRHPTAHSPELVRAFRRQVAGVVGPVEPRALVVWRPAARAVGALALVGAGLFAAIVTWPVLGQGLRTLFHRPSLFEGAAVSSAPLVGEVRLTYEYPSYTGLPNRTVEGSTGDVAAVKGTRVHLETRPLRAARKALLLFGDSGERGQARAALSDGKLSADLTLAEDGSYRFWLEPSFGRPIREERAHRLTVEPDAPPRVEILGPADRLELASPRPIEIGYSASDDFGLGVVELVVRVGDRPEQRVPLRDGAGARAVQGRTLWDPASASLTGVERIAYRVEARDRDDVSGPKIGSSRTLYLVIQNPHESLEDRLDRQREILEKLLGDLGDRLEHTTDPTPEAHLAAVTVAHEAEESHLALLGRLLDEDRQSGVLSKSLRASLGGIADRLERLLREEARALGALKNSPAGAGHGRLDASSTRQIAELESDVLLLDDLIGRQRLEDLASLGKELTDAQQRLQDLLERYRKTKDEGLRRQLAREARELRARLAALAQEIAAVRDRNDVPEEWRNLPDMKGLADEARKLDEMLERGDDRDLDRALARLGEDLRGMRKMLDQNLDGFGAERFPEENRVVADLMKKVGDVEGDERTLQKETQAIADQQEAEVQRRLQGQMDEVVKKEVEKIERLKQRLGGVPTGDPESALAEEIDRARESAKQMRRLLAERDLAEAKGEAERAESSLERAAEHLDDLAEARRSRRPGTDAELDKGAEAVGAARGLAQEIAEDLDKLMPRPSDTLTPAQRETARAQADKQSAIGRRTEEIAEEAGRRLGKLPGLEKAEGELKGAATRMRQASDSLKKDESKPAATAERDAADRLSKLRDSMQSRSMGGASQHRDPVRIPGADESSAPRAWRQELLDAMKEKAPERYRDEVRRYYEELVK